MNGPCDFHDHPPYSEVVQAAQAFRDALDATCGEVRLAKARETLRRTSCP